jgi:hypothetical protein
MFFPRGRAAVPIDGPRPLGAQYTNGLWQQGSGHTVWPAADRTRPTTLLLVILAVDLQIASSVEVPRTPFATGGHPATSHCPERSARSGSVRAPRFLRIRRHKRQQGRGYRPGDASVMARRRSARGLFSLAGLQSQR